MKLDYNFHTHTERCGHAQGSDEEYVISAIASGIKVLGFSDHIMFPDIYQPRVRGSFEQLDDYVKSINALKEKYRGQIEILLGFEAEYFPQYDDFYKELFDKYHFDYLIQGQHFIFDENHQITYAAKQGYFEGFDNYFALLKQGVESGYFTYICHPDLFVCTGNEFNEKMRELSHKICTLCQKIDIPLEINLHGLLWEAGSHLLYANEEFFAIASQYNLSFTIGIDAHNPKEFSNNHLEFANYLVEKYHLHLLSKEEILSRIRRNA